MQVPPAGIRPGGTSLLLFHPFIKGNATLVDVYPTKVGRFSRR